jgi:putative endonuclease
MVFYVYMLKCISDKIKKTYVGYTNNLSLRLNKHNSNKGAKATRGLKWKIIYKRKFITKKTAMSYEYRLKKDKMKRNMILKNLNE